MLRIEFQTGIDGKQYKVVNGTWYHPDTLDEVIKWVETFRERRSDCNRVKFTYGNFENGIAVSELYTEVGYVERTCGPIKAPITIFKETSRFGDLIPTHLIMRIEYANKKYCKRVVWEHPTRQQAKVLAIQSVRTAGIEYVGIEGVQHV
jgi:hypothetical protein